MDYWRCSAYADSGRMLEHISGLPDLILLWVNGVFIRVSRCGVTRGTLSNKHVLTLIWKIMTGGSLKIVLNWVVLIVSAKTTVGGRKPRQASAATSTIATSAPSHLPSRTTWGKVAGDQRCPRSLAARLVALFALVW